PPASRAPRSPTRWVDPFAPSGRAPTSSTACARRSSAWPGRPHTLATPRSPQPPSEASMRIAIGADHAGYDLKSHLVTILTGLDHTVIDLGTDGTSSVDYPGYCAAVGRAVVRGDAERGIVLGGSGQGEQIAANKVDGVRAALCNDLYTARMAREHNDANVLSMGGRIVAPALADEIVV